jgi:hypothetical protein
MRFEPSIIIATTTPTLQSPPSVNSLGFLPYATDEIGLVRSLAVIFLPLFRIPRIKICESRSAVNFQL